MLIFFCLALDFKFNNLVYQFQEVSSPALTPMDSTPTPQTVRSITSVPMGSHTSTPVTLALSGTQTSTPVTGKPTYNATQV